MRYLPARVKNLALRTLCVCCLLYPTPALPQADIDSLAVYTEVRNPPVLTFNEDGSAEIRNPATRLVEALLAEAGIDYRINVLPWARLQLTLQDAHNTLAYPVGRTPEREQEYEWIGLIRPLEMNLYGLRERAPELPTTLDEAASYRIASIRGDVVDTHLRKLKFPHLISISSNAPRVELLERGRVDLVPFAAHGVESFLRENNYAVDTLYPAVNLTHVTDGLYIIMSKASDPALVARLKQAYQRLIDNGTYSDIMKNERMDSDITARD